MVALLACGTLRGQTEPAVSEFTQVPLNCVNQADEYEIQVVRTHLDSWQTSTPIPIYGETRTRKSARATQPEWHTMPERTGCIDAISDMIRRGGQERDISAGVPDHPVRPAPYPDVKLTPEGEREMWVVTSRVGFDSSCTYAWVEQTRHNLPDWNAVHKEACFRRDESGSWVKVVEEWRPSWN